MHIHVYTLKLYFVLTVSMTYILHSPQIHVKMEQKISGGEKEKRTCIADSSSSLHHLTLSSSSHLLLFPSLLPVLTLSLSFSLLLYHLLPFSHPLSLTQISHPLQLSYPPLSFFNLLPFFSSPLSLSLTLSTFPITKSDNSDKSDKP